MSSSLLSLKDIAEKGELTVSLKYQILSNKITVVIMKAVGLPNISKIFAIGKFTSSEQNYISLCSNPS
jgi:hypothetical protein